MSKQLADPTWTPYLGTDSATLALPDYHSNYFGYAFDWKNNQHVGLRITGEFGYARYMSYNIYDEVSGASFTALKDIQITPQPGNVNPFVAGNPADATNREYVVNIYCKTPATETLKVDNPLTFKTSDNVTALLVILRYYMPEKDARAGVPFPVIQAFDTRTNQNVPTPPNIAISKMPEELYQKRMANIFETVVDNTLRFYRAEGAGQYNNADNLYLITAVENQSDLVLILKFQAPLFGLTNSQYPSADVRYWSFNQGNANTSTPIGMPDQTFNVAKDGLTYIAMGAESIKDWAHKGGYNFMPWKATSAQAVVLYRNLVTNSSFQGAISKVPNLVLTDVPINGPNDPRINCLAASQYIFAYAPTGKKVTQAEFLANYGGMPSPGFKVAG